MKVCYLTNLPAPYTVEFFNELGKLCELTVIYERESAADRDEKWRSEADSCYKEIFLHGLKIGSENSFCPQVVKYLKDDFDAIVIGVYSTFTAMVAIRYLIKKKREYYFSTDGGFIKEETTGKRKLKTYLIGNAKGWFSPGSNTDKYLEYYGAKSEKIYRYPFTSLDCGDILSEPLDEKKKTELRKRLNLPEGTLAIGVGQFIHRKGWDILIDAIFRDSSLSNIHFLIVGGEENQFNSLIQSPIPDNVRIIPFISKRELFEYYRAADFFVLPTREDIWGLVVNEALACGLPVITTDKCNAGIELINDGINGYLCKTDDESLAYAVSRICKDDLMKMSKEAIASIGKYTYSNMAERYYEEIETN